MYLISILDYLYLYSIKRTNKRNIPKNKYSSYQPASVSQWHAHSREVVLKTPHRAQRETIIFPLIIYISKLFTIYCCSVLRVIFNFSPSIFSPAPFRRHCYGFLRPCHINSQLLPPPHPYLCPWCTLRPLTQV